MPTLGIYTLGCKVNQYESEAIAEAAVASGFTVLSPEEVCDVYIINTCTVTGESDRKSRQFIRRAVTSNPDAGIIVTGCLSQVSPESAAFEGVDCVIGSSDKLSAVTEALWLAEHGKRSAPEIKVTKLDCAGFEKMNITHFPRTRAYIKIEDGCESNCSYCIIPRARGKIRSKSADNVLREIETLAASGCREVVLTGIETAAYGKDLGDYRLADLLTDADRVSGGRMRIRLGSLDPSLIRPAFVEKIAKLESMAPHFHLSMQSGSDAVLAMMKRRYNSEMALSGMELLREAMPDVQFTTDLIVGFPCETDENFRETVDFADRAGFLDAHIFAYSKRAGTPAAQMSGQISPQIKKERSAKLIDSCRRVTDRILNEQIGKVYPVLFETFDGSRAVGHTPSFIEVSVPSDATLHSQIRNVEILAAENGVCIGRLKP